MNKAIISGRIVSDPDIKQTSNGKSVISFTVATQRKFKNQNGEYESDFIRCKAWGGTADFVSKYFSKGEPIELAGRIETGSYENENGDKIYTTEVVADEVNFTLNKKKDQVKSDVPLPFDL